MSPSLQRHLPLLTTAFIFALLFATASFMYTGFLSGRVVINILGDYAAVGITAIGMTLVIFSGGIDLSVGAVIGFTSIFCATMVEQHHWHPLAAAAVALALGAALGLFMGTLIQKFKLPPFLITLAGMFLARGSAFWISTESTGISHPLFVKLSQFEAPIGPDLVLPLTSVSLLVVLVIGYLLAHYTRFGRNLLAIGGSEQSAILMGLPVASTKILAYTLNSTLAAFAGLIATIYTGSGNPSLGIGLELDAIAIVVIGGTLLTGGRGHMLGTLLGILVFGTIQSAILFDGRLSASLVRIVVAGLLLVFILLQRALARTARR